ncbi:lysophospholipid acyltransferase family protein [Bacteroidota bacterium]|nr:lysophospholipid acyltransferase family protein [Bacteroidota bacterium]
MKYLLLILLWIVSLLPFQVLYLISKIIRFIVYDILCYREKVVIDNIQNTFIEKSQTEVIKLKNNFYAYFFELIVEIIKLLSISNDELNKRFTFSNINVIKKTLKQNKSVIVVVGHYGNWEWALRSASNLINTKIIGVYKRINNRIFEWLLLKIRSNTKVFPVEIKSLSRELVNNNEKKIYAIVADQSPTLEQSNVRINFLNRDTLVYTGVEKISKKYNMPVFYLNIKLTRKGYYESTFEEICRKNINGKNLEITKEFFSKLENQIKSEPRLWLWSHKRWKHTN